MDFKEPENFGEHQLSYRTGDIVVPRVDAAEPLGLELQDAARAIRTRRLPPLAARAEVVAAIEAAETSLHLGGEPVALRRRSSARPPEPACAGDGNVNGAVNPRLFPRC